MLQQNDETTRVAIAFQEAYWKDRADGARRSLGDYLALFPDHHATVTREYLAAEGASDTAAELEDAAPPTESGTVLERIGHYRIVSELGRGGQGVVYLAEDTRLGRTVALKVLTARDAPSLSATLRFHREATVASKLAHPGICLVYDVGRESGVSYIAMRHVEGETLARRIARSEAQPGSPEIPGILKLIGKVARALHAAHEAGVIHRDVKPQNIMVGLDGDPVVLDFGLAREDAGSAVTLTGTGEIFGTPAYLSPEQLERKPDGIDRRADVYALGVTLYECLTLERPFEGPTREALYRAILNDEPEDPRRRNRVISRDLSVVVLTALQKDRDRRYRTAAAFSDDLLAVIEGRPIAARPIGPITRAIRWTRKRPAAAALVALLVVGLPFFGMFAVWHSANQEKVREADQARVSREIEAGLEDGFIELGEGSPPAARRAFEAVLALDGDNPEAIAGITLSLIREEQFEDALSWIDAHASALERSPGLAQLRADPLRALGRKTEADAVERARTQPRSALEHFLSGSIPFARYHRGDRAGAEPALDAFLAAIQCAQHARVLFHMEALHAAGHIGNPARIRPLASAIRQLWPRSVRALRSAASILRSIGDVDDAMAALDAAATLRPHDVNTLLVLAACHTIAERWDDAERVYRQVIAMDPGSVTAHRDYGWLLLTRDRIEEGVAETNEAARVAPNDGDVIGQLGSISAMKGNLEEAISLFQKATKRKPAHEEVIQANWGHALERLGRPKEAIERYERAIEIKPTGTRAHVRLGFVRRDAGEYEAARAHFARELEIRPQSVSALFEIGVTWETEGDLAKAKEWYDRALAKNPKYGYAILGLARCLRKQGKLDDALVKAEEAVSVDAAEPSAWFDLAGLRAEKKSFNGAVDAVERTIALSPTYAEAWCNLGQYLRSLGRYRESVEALRKGHELGIAKPNWSYDSKTWLAEAEKLAEIEAKVEAVGRGEVPVPTLEEWMELGSSCRNLRATELEAIVLSKAIETGDQKTARKLRIHAAALAALAGAERPPWRLRAIGFLSAELDDLEQRVSAPGANLAAARRSVSSWKIESRLASIRDPSAQIAATPEELAASTALWKRVDEFLGLEGPSSRP